MSSKNQGISDQTQILKKSKTERKFDDVYCLSVNATLVKELFSGVGEIKCEANTKVNVKIKDKKSLKKAQDTMQKRIGEIPFKLLNVENEEEIVLFMLDFFCHGSEQPVFVDIFSGDFEKQKSDTKCKLIYDYDTAKKLSLHFQEENEKDLFKQYDLGSSHYIPVKTNKKNQRIVTEENFESEIKFIRDYITLYFTNFSL